MGTVCALLAWFVCQPQLGGHPERPPAPAQPPARGTDVAFRMEYAVPGVLDDIRARAATRRVPGSDEVEIRVHAAGLNFIDAMRALGVYPGQVDGPVRVGIECAGTVTAVGDGVDEFRVGDAVLGTAPFAAIADFVVVPADGQVIEKPEPLTFEVAGSLGVVGRTAMASSASLGLGEQDIVQDIVQRHDILRIVCNHDV